ncbi:tripartite motif-containing protein 10-like [Paroedura picta]|uniref:tripartite motif-containing protein 10-like n=1 Tax=Paroedura picta TaxID=143630 RepID=UPI0040569523
MASAHPSIGMELEVTCPICMDFLTHPMVLDCGHSFCQGCITSYCDKKKAQGDLECPVCKFKFQKGNFHPNWQLASLVDKIKLMPLSSGKGDVCWKHKEKLHLFCQEDAKMVCMLCERSPEHQGHTVLLLEKAAQQYEDKIFNCLETLRTEREKIREYVVDVQDESREMLKKTELERQNRMAEFKTLHQLLKEQENDLLAQIEEVEKEIARRRDDHLAKLSEELSSLESLIREMEETCQQPVNELLRDAKGTLQRYEKKETFEKPEAFPSDLLWKLSDSCDYLFLDSAMKQLKDTLAWAFPKRRATVTLDPATASPRLVLSADRKSIRWQSAAGDLFKDPQKHCGFVLGREGFIGGCHFWEVSLGSEDSWAVGVARRPVMGRVTLTPEEGIWAVGRWKGQYKAFIKDTDCPLTLRGEPYLLRICLNYNGGRVAFLDAKRAALLYEFSGAFFCGETLYPFFAVYGKGCLGVFP